MTKLGCEKERSLRTIVSAMLSYDHTSCFSLEVLLGVKVRVLTVAKYLYAPACRSDAHDSKIIARPKY